MVQAWEGTSPRPSGTRKEIGAAIPGFAALHLGLFSYLPYGKTTHNPTIR
jgi:hypothetical protein